MAIGLKRFDAPLLRCPGMAKQKVGNPNRMQPLDVGVFAPFKRFYAHYADVWQRSNPGHAIAIYEVASLTSSSIIKAFTSKNIKSGFKSPGIYPLDA